MFKEENFSILNNDIEEVITKNFNKAIKKLCSQFMIGSCGYCLQDKDDKFWEVKYMDIDNTGSIIIYVHKLSN